METAVALSPSSACNNDATTKPSDTNAGSSDSSVSVESPRLFILCGRDQKVEQVRDLFARYGVIRQLHLATDRSNKSRGFAFLQYEDPSSAVEAIKHLDKTTLSDGHVLKVTVAREKSTTTSSIAKGPTQPGKLKRNQHSQDESDGKGDDGSATDGGASSGKRQRSSPPSSAINLPKLWKRATPLASLLVATRSPEDEIADVLGGIIAQIERLHGEETEMSVTLPAVATMPAAAKRKAPMTLVRSPADGGDERSTSSERSVSRGECESTRPCKLKAQRTTVAQATPSRPIRQAVWCRDRRRVPVDESDSSVDDASDTSVGRRKRSNTEPDEPETNARSKGTTRRRLSDLRELSLSPTGTTLSPMTSKKRCSRRSSASSSSSLPGFQPVPFRPLAPMFAAAMPPSIAPPPTRRRRTGPRAKLFFTSTVKFTLQELEAMFSVYEQFEHVQMTKSFGRLKTMAYVKYASPEAARSVLTSFRDDNEGEDHGMMKLVYADSDEATPRFRIHAPSGRHTMTNTAGESTSSEAPTDAELPPVILTENCWLMILYDRGLTNEAISSCATACDGMEFMDIKMFRSTGESQGVAFVKFETEEFTQAASRQLHNLEFPTGSRKFLQAIVISDPALFSTAHGATASAATQASGQAPLAPHPGEDGDLGFVEARFAHLMSGTNDGSMTPMTHAVSADEGHEEYAAPPGFNPFVQHSRPPPPSSPYGYFQFGQPFPYPHMPHTYPQHPPFYPPGGYTDNQSWGYDGMYPVWPGEGGSPMLSDYSNYSWESATPGATLKNESTSPEVTSVYVSSSRPLDLSSLTKVIQECPGVVGFTKEERDGIAYVVDFGEPRLAADAVTKLDGTMCNGNKLRVAVATGHRPPPSRRKRQRLDQRGRRK